MQTHTRALLVALVVLAVLIVPVGTALAQGIPGATNGTQAQTETNTSSPADSSTENATENESEGAASNGGGLGSGLGGGFSLSMYEAENPLCQDMNAASAFTCDSVVGLMLSTGEAVMEFYVAIQSGVISFILDRPGAMQDGNMVFFGAPDNQPMTAIHEYWTSQALPVSLVMWGVIMVVNMFAGILPFGGNSKYAQARALETGAVVFFGIIASWFIGNLILHGSFALSTALAPSPEMLAADPESMQADTKAAVIGALAIYLGYGVVAALALLMFAVTFIGAYILLPALSVGMLFKHPQVWILRRMNKYGDKVFDLFLTCALWPIPAAIVLGIGYPATAAIAAMSPETLGFVPGVAPTETSVLAILRLGVWMLALIAPLVIFALSSPSSAVAGAASAVGGYSLGTASGGAAGAATGASAGSAAGSASALPAAASGATSGTASTMSSVGTNPIKGTSLSADAASASSTAGSLPSGSTSLASSPQSSSTGSVARAAASDTTSSDTAAGAAAGDSSASPESGDIGSAPDGSGGITRVTDRSEFDGSQRYEYGYEKGDGDFQVIENHTVRGDSLVDKGLASRVQEVYDDRNLLLREPESGELMNVSDIAARDRDLETQLSPDVQSQQSRDTVFGTRDETPN